MGWRVTFLAGIAIVAIASVAIAAQGGSSDVTLCAVKKSGELSLASHGKCGKGEKKLVLSQRGPTGARGPAGSAGAPGKDGSAADLAPGPVHLVGQVISGQGEKHCQAAVGTFCGDPSCSTYYWHNVGSPNANVSYQMDAAGYVHLQGAASPGNGGGGTCGVPSPMFYLPPGYRPTEGSLSFPCGTKAGTFVKIGTDGAVDTVNYECESVSGIVFRP